MKHRFHQVDVFTAVPLRGNPLAVVHAAQGLDEAAMAAFARWTNLSETTFLLPPQAVGADYRVRIFTPGGELPFAGHPTLGSCWAWLAAGGTPKLAGTVVQECGVGLVRVRQQGGRPAFAAPPLRRSGPLESGLLERIVKAIGVNRAEVLHHQWVDNGPGWCAVMLRSAAAVQAVRVDGALLGDVKLGLVGPHPTGSDCAFELRALYPMPSGLAEDPVTGSLNASVAQWLIGAGLAPPRYVAAQGTLLQRAGRVHIEQVGDTVWVGGDVTPVIEGEVDAVNTGGAATAVDHLVVAAATLAQGVAWCEATLGITPGPGGKHALMGTHNRLFSIATEAFPLAYFEIVAIDPDAPPPGRPRWFGLDDVALQARIAAQPQLVHMVARSAMLDMHRWGLVTVGLQPGEPVRAGRDTPQGRLDWQIMLRLDGTLLCGGALPTLIQWGGAHPAERMPASGVTLRALSLRGVPEKARTVLRLRGVLHAEDAGPALRATLSTPLGDVTLESA